MNIIWILLCLKIKIAPAELVCYQCIGFTDDEESNSCNKHFDDQFPRPMMQISCKAECFKIWTKRKQVMRGCGWCDDQKILFDIENFKYEKCVQCNSNLCNDSKITRIPNILIIKLLLAACYVIKKSIEL